jgi:hypothetical protein
MTSILKADEIQDSSGNLIIKEVANAITIGASGDTISIPAGATIANSGTATGFGQSVLIKEVDASDVAAVTFENGTSSVVFDNTYKVYFLTMTNITMAGDEEVFLRALSGGSALTSGYWTAQFGSYGSSTPNAYSDRYENAFMGSPGDVESTRPFSGWAYFYNVGVSSEQPQAMGQIQMCRSNGNIYGFGFSGSYNTAISNFDGFTLTNAGGPNITSGNFKLYGIK